MSYLPGMLSSAGLFKGGPQTQLALKASDLPNLRRIILPFEQQPMIFGNVAVFQRDNPILRTLARRRDEREFRLMRQTEPAISNPIRSLTHALLGFGSQFVIPRSKRRSKAAETLKAFCEAALSSRAITDFHVNLSEFTRCVYEGWLPIQCWWSPTAFSFRGKSYWGIDRIFPQKQERFAVSAERELVWLGWGFTDPLVFDDPIEKLGWVVCRSGSTLSPYGEALLGDIWLYWFMKQKFFEWFGRGMRNAAQGIPVFKEGMGALDRSGFRADIPDESGGPAMQQLKADIAETLRILEEYGILVVTGGMEYQQIVNHGFSGEFVKALDYLDLAMRLGIEGQHLTSTVGEHGGSRALGQTQERTKIDWARNLASHVEPIVNQIVERILQVNIRDLEGVELDPEDVPQFEFKILNRVDREKAVAFTTMGGELDAREVGEDWGLPVADPTDPKEEGGVLKAPAPAVGAKQPGEKSAPGTGDSNPAADPAADQGTGT